MILGTIVQYTPREGEESYAAVVTRVWPEGTVGLQLFGHDSMQPVRAALPEQLEVLVDPNQLYELNADLARLLRHVNRLETELAEIRASAPEPIAAQTVPPAETLSAVPEPDVSDQSGQLVDDRNVESTRASKKRAAWPTR